MTAIDQAALIEVTARRLHRIDCDCPELDAPDHSVDYGAMVDDSLPIIARELLAPIRELAEIGDDSCWLSKGSLVVRVTTRKNGYTETESMIRVRDLDRLIDLMEADMKGSE